MQVLRRHERDRTELLEQVIGWNRWDLLAVPDLNTYQPRCSVTVIIPIYQAQPQLERTLAGIAAQSFPREQLEVIVVDDGSDPPVELATQVDGLDVRILRQERRGFGAPRARNLGAAQASGDVLVFLDADMIPERDHLRAHARWHEASASAVTLGRRVHASFDDLDSLAVGRAVAEQALDTMLADRDQQTPTWIEAHLRRTDDLRSQHDDLFRVVTSGNLGVSRALFEQVGGFDASFDRWGGEDIELGYRLFTSGAFLIPEPVARCWHQGAGHEPSESERRSLEEQRARLANLIAHRGFRNVRGGRSFEVPRIALRVDAGSCARTSIDATVDSILRSTVHDLAVVVAVSDDHPDLDWLRFQYGGDPRLAVVEAHAAESARDHRVPFQGSVPAGVLLAPDALARTMERLTDAASSVGVVEVTVPGRATRAGHLRMWSTRAQTRLRTSVGNDLIATEPLLADAIARTFGGEWLSGYDLGLEDADNAAPELPGGADALPSRPVSDGQHDALLLWEALAQLDHGTRTRLLTVAHQALDGLGAAQLRRLLRLAGPVLRLLRGLNRLRPRRVVRGVRRRWKRLRGGDRSTVGSDSARR